MSSSPVGDVPSELPRSLFGMLRFYLRRRRAQVAALGTLLVSATALQSLSPLIVRFVLDSALAGAAIRVLVLWAIAYSSAALVQQVAVVAATYLSVRVGWLATNALRADLLSHTLRLDMRFHNDKSPGEMIERIDGDVTLMSNYFAEFVVQIIGSALLVVIILIALLLQDWRAAAIMGGFVGVSVAVLLGLRKVGVEHWQRARQASGELYGFLEETLSAIEDIHTSNGKPFIIRNFYRLTRVLMQRQISAAMRTNVLINAWLLVDTVSYAVGLGLGAFLFLNGWATLGLAYLVFHYAGMLSRPLRAIVFQMEDFQRAAAAARRAVHIFGERSRLAPAGPAAATAPAVPGELPAGSLAVELRDVTFGYRSDRPVLHDVSLQVPAGQTLGLIGRTGSGKTTISRLLFRLYDVDGGSVRIDGRDVRDLSLANLRTRVAMVNQRVDLVHGSVRDNLTLFDDSIADDEVTAVLDDLGMGAWWRALPEGVHTELAGHSAELSAGQAQLLAFGRVFLLGTPGIVVLDEASSRLDPATEQSIERAVERLCAGRTAIIIAHRLATVMRANRVALLEAGRVAELGERAELMADPSSRLAQLLRGGTEGMLE